MHTHAHTHGPSLSLSLLAFVYPHSHPLLSTTDDSKKCRVLCITAKDNETLEGLTKVFYDRDGNPDITNEMVALMRESKGFSSVTANSLLQPGTRVRMPAPPEETQQHLWCNGRSRSHRFQWNTHPNSLPQLIFSSICSAFL